MSQPELARKALAMRAESLLSDPFFRPRQIAEITGRHYHSITAAIRAGEMKAQKLGKRAIGVRASELQRWLDSMNSGEQEAPDAP
jgi:predicted DNA-binding transcriptional regulator AlpA